MIPEVTKAAAVAVYQQASSLSKAPIGEADAKIKAAAKEVYQQTPQKASEALKAGEVNVKREARVALTEEETKAALEKQAESKRKSEKFQAIVDKKPDNRSDAEYYLVMRDIFYTGVKDLKMTQEDLKEQRIIFLSVQQLELLKKQTQLRYHLDVLLKGFAARPSLTDKTSFPDYALSALLKLSQDTTIIIDVEAVKNYLGAWDSLHYQMISDCVEVIPQKPLLPLGDYLFELLWQTRNAIITAKKESLNDNYTRLRMFKSEFSKKMREHPDYINVLVISEVLALMEHARNLDELLKLIDDLSRSVLSQRNGR